jgi:hypothetical protein
MTIKRQLLRLGRVLQRAALEQLVPFRHLVSRGLVRPVLHPA